MFPRLLEAAAVLLTFRGVGTHDLPSTLVSFVGTVGLDFPVRVAEATGIADMGRGVFATRAIQPGEVLTMYPCHALMMRSEHDHSGLIDIVTRDNKRHGDPVIAHMLQKYKHYLWKRDGVVADIVGDPTYPCEAHACAHMLNDPHPNIAALDLDPADAAAHWEALMAYERAVGPLQNCRFHLHKGQAVFVVATRDIAEGEELLVPYSYEFWCHAPDAPFLDWIKQHAAHLRREQPEKYAADIAVLSKRWNGLVHM